MSESIDRKGKLNAHEAQIKIYMNIFNVSREEAIAALQNFGLIPSEDSAKEEKK